VAPVVASDAPVADATHSTVARPHGPARHDATRVASIRPKAVTGAKHWVILRCQYKDTWPGAIKRPKSSTYFQAMFSNATPHRGSYWASTSYGKISISATVAGTADEYRQVQHENTYFGADQTSQDADKLAEACADVWDVSITFASSTYYAFVY